MTELLGLFRVGIAVDLVTGELQNIGIGMDQMLVIPLKGEADERSVHAVGRGGKSRMDFSFLTGTICMLLGCIYGYILPLGPVLWGLFGLIGGMVLGFAIEAIIRPKFGLGSSSRFACMMIAVQCREEDASRVRDIFRTYGVLGVGVHSIPPPHSSVSPGGVQAR